MGRRQEVGNYSWWRTFLLCLSICDWISVSLLWTELSFMSLEKRVVFALIVFIYFHENICVYDDHDQLRMRVYLAIYMHSHLFTFVNQSLRQLLYQAGSPLSFTWEWRVLPCNDQELPGRIQTSLPRATQKELKSFVAIVSRSHRVSPLKLVPEDCNAWSLYMTQRAHAGTLGWLFS